MSSGILTRPSDVPLWTKKRLVQVGPGTDENQRSQTVKCWATQGAAPATPAENSPWSAHVPRVFVSGYACE